MTVTYDPDLNVAYIQLAEKDDRVTESREFADGRIIVDIDAKGELFGIELLNAREQLKKSDGKFAFINSMTNEKKEMLLPAL